MVNMQKQLCRWISEMKKIYCKCDHEMYLISIADGSVPLSVTLKTYWCKYCGRAYQSRHDTETKSNNGEEWYEPEVAKLFHF